MLAMMTLKLCLNGYSVLSLIDDILAHGCNREDQKIKLLREWVEREPADIICARLLGHHSASASVLSSLSIGTASMPTNGPKK